MAIRKLIPALLLAWSAVCAPAQAGSPARAGVARDGVEARSAPRPHPATAEERSADDLKPAEDLLQKQQYQQAEEKLLVLVAKDSANPQAWFDLGFAQSHLDKTADAVAAYRKATELSPKWFEAQQNLGLVLAKSGDFRGAAAALKIAVTLKPAASGPKPLGEAWISLAQVTMEFDPREAWLDLKKAAELAPLDDEIMMGLADQIAARSSDQGEPIYRELAERGRSGAVARLASLYIRQKRYAEAETWLRKYTSENPSNPAAKVQLGKLLAAEGKTQEAIGLLQPAYDAAPDRDLARELAGLYLDAKQYDPAAALLQPLAAQNANDPQIHYDYGSVLLHQHKYPEAQAELLKAIQLKPNLTEAYFDLAYAAQQNKNYELAIRVLDARAKIQPETPATYFLRAEAYDSLRMYKPAAENYKLFLRVAGGKFPDQEFQARHRLKAIQPD